MRHWRSVTSAALDFELGHCRITLLDTPGHQDFSEDTYRTLFAVDSVIIVIDAAKGIEAQTRKLFEVCRLRRLPVLTFVNKLDLPGRDPFDLMDEIEQVLGIHAAAVNWPIGSGDRFRGVFDLFPPLVRVYERVRGGAFPAPVSTADVGDPVLSALYAGDPLRYPRVPRFPPEHFGRARLVDTRAKQFDAGLRQLGEEGLMQVIFPVTARREPVLCVVGPLQMEVVEARLRQEYGVECRIEPLSVSALRWLRGDPQEVADVALPSAGVVRATDRDGRAVLLFESAWHLTYCTQHNPGVEFATVG